MSHRSIEDGLAEGRARLASTSPTAALDARVLMGHATGLRHDELIARGAEALDDEVDVRYESLVAARARGRPVAHLVGMREFWSLDIGVDPDVLIPRPETELLVERALWHLRDRRAPRILDLGTGSGAIAAAIASEREDAWVVASDVSRAATRLAARNIGATPGAAHIVCASWLSAFVPGSFDLVAWNPPYVAARDPALDHGDLRFEPRIALVGGPGGLGVIRTQMSAAALALRPGGWLLVEHGADQGTRVRGLITATGLQHVTTRRDHANHERLTEGQRSPDSGGRSVEESPSQLLHSA